MSDFTITTTANFNTDCLLSDVATDTQEWSVTANQIQLSFPYAVKDANLVSYWRFSDSGATITDEVGTNNMTKPATTPDFTTSGKFGGAYDFVRANTDYLDLVGRPSTSYTGSIVAWVKTDVVGAGVYYSICGLGDSDVNAFMRYFLLCDGTNCKTLLDQRPDGTANYDAVAGENTMVAGTWYMVTVTSNGTAWKMYLNDNAESTTVTAAPNTGAWFGDTVPGTPHFNIGGSWINGASSNYFDGVIDEVKIYDDELSSSEISALYNSGNQYKATGNWRSASQTMTASHKLKDITITHSGLDANTFIDKIEILDASDNSLICTYGTNIVTGASTNLVTGDFDGTGFTDTANTNFKIKVYFDGNAGTTTPVITQIEGNYEEAAAVTYNLNFSKVCTL